MTKIVKDLVPVDYDIHFKYVCPDHRCGIQHWKSLREVATKNFKIVCDCGLVIKPKRVKSLTINYAEVTKSPDQTQDKIPEKTTEQAINIDLLNKATSVLIGYGFTKEESNNLLIDSYNKNPTQDIGTLIKNTLESFGVNNLHANASI